ncbi:hypothetical protein Vretimale_4665 [Volvox reticuliferus]|uniref:Uncharacterized protein n=2 Tax=Volvox reticuliferus TaxID=1737510 RepID=A0A8J4G519_9CHLO|nr:hypothetical protein Vretimale_4665 [Volvox reticuliferus]
MGKSKQKGKRKKSEFDTFFDKKEGSDEGWASGVSAMALDGNCPDISPTMAAGSTGMEIGDAPRCQVPKGTALRVQKVSMKNVRGQRTKAQKLRKNKKIEKATARADKEVVRMGSRTTHKQTKNSLKAIY